MIWFYYLVARKFELYWIKIALNNLVYEVYKPHSSFVNPHFLFKTHDTPLISTQRFHSLRLEAKFT